MLVVAFTEWSDSFVWLSWFILKPGIGYNGFPRGCSDDKLPWAKVRI